MKLYIDDIRQAPKGWTLARTINSAINAIIQFEPTEISLDHDISHETTIDGNYLVHSSDECFCAVALFIGERYKNKLKPKITLHTANPNGAEKMAEKLGRYDIQSVTKLSSPAIRQEKTIRE